MGIRNVRHSHEVPVDRLTHLANTACTAIEGAPESDGNECGVILLANTAGTEHGGMQFGFDDEGDAIDFLLRHAEAMCKAAGRSFQIVNVDAN